MKTEIEIKFKIAVHESEIDKLLAKDRSEWDDYFPVLIERCLMGRKALLWVLSGKDAILTDDYEKQAMYECMCHDSTKIF